MIRRIYTAVVGLLLAGQGLAQEPAFPHRLLSEEKIGMEEYLASRSRTQVPNPPPAQVRTMAEWEEIQALIISWAGQSAILREIVRNAVNECKVFIITNNQSTVEDQLINTGIPLDSVRFLDVPFNTIWVRDYGPWSVYKNDVDSLWIVDWIYNRPREDDDTVPIAIADYLGVPIYEATSEPFDWVHTGGNHLPDGMGTVFSSELVLEENPDKTEAEIDSIALLYLGVKQYIKLPTLPYDGIHHLDMHMRIIDEETILVGQYPDGVADGPQIEANIQYIQENFRTTFGNPYKIIRLPMPPDQNGRYPDSGGNYRTYTNSIFVNKTILVPTYEEQYDTTALRIYRENLPGYNVVGINCNSIIGQLGALHCITKTVGDDDPLLIAHARLREVDNTIGSYPLEAYIRHRDGIASASVFYRTSLDSSYSEIQLTLTDSSDHIWSAAIPGYEANTEVQYYIEAHAHNGKTQVRPIVAPAGYFRFNVIGEEVNMPPTVRITGPMDSTIFDIALGQIPITFEAVDPDGEIVEAKLIINFEEIATLDTLPYVVDWTHPGVGTYFAYVQVMDNDSAIVYSDQVSIFVEQTTATGEPVSSAIRIYPNPSDNMLWIASVEAINDDIQLVSSLGQQMNVVIDCIGSQRRMNLEHLPAGMYVLIVGKEAYKIIKL